MFKREKLLKSLVMLDRPLDHIRHELSMVEWDSEKEIVFLTRDHIINILQHFLDGQLKASEVEEWANMIEGREDIGFQIGLEDFLSDIIFELANPHLTEVLTFDKASSFIKKLKE